MNNATQRYIALFVLSMGAAASYTLVYIKYIFYDAWVAGLGLAEGANESAGWLLTFHMIGNAICYIPGGYIADRFSPKWILSLSLVGTGLLNVWYSFDPSYETSRIIWPLLSLTCGGFAYWSAMIKAVRMLGSPQEQGKMYGWYNAGEGAFASVILGAATVAFGIALVPADSLRYAVWVQAAFCFLAAILTFIFFDEKLAVSDSENPDDVFRARDILKVVKNPWVWCVSILVMCCYGTYTGQSYLTPYMTQVLQVSATTGAFLGVLRTKGARFLGGPIGGILADRVGSPCKVIIWSNILLVALLSLFFIFPPTKEAILFPIALSLAIALVNFAAYNIMFASFEEAHIPRYLTGTGVAIVSLVGYSPDGFMNTIFGNWLDNYGNAGHTYIFMSLIGMAVIGSFFAWLIMRRNQKILAQQRAAA